MVLSYTYLTIIIIPQARTGSELIAIRPLASRAIDSEAIRVRGIIIVYVKIQLVCQKNTKTKLLSLVRAKQNTIQPPMFWFSQPVLFVTCGL